MIYQFLQFLHERIIPKNSSLLSKHFSLNLILKIWTIERKIFISKFILSIWIGWNQFKHQSYYKKILLRRPTNLKLWKKQKKKNWHAFKAQLYRGFEHRAAVKSPLESQRIKENQKKKKKNKEKGERSILSCTQKLTRNFF